MSLVVENLIYTYMPGTPFESKAVDDVSFSIGSGEYVGIIGHTGSGKTTLIKIMCALLKQDSGKVLLNGQDIGAKGYDKKMLRKSIGVVFQYPEYQLFEETVYKDIAFGPKKQGLSDDEVDKNVRSAMDMLDLPFDEVSERSPFELSGGQKRRVAIAGVLAMFPEILILDEPVAGLDPMGRKNLFWLINKLNKEGTTIILITHSMDDLAQNAKRVLVLDHGKILMDDTPKEVFGKSYVLQEIGLDIPQVSKIALMLNERGVIVDNSVLTIDKLEENIIELFGKN